MNIIHNIWLPQATQDFRQSVAFYLWIESDEVHTKFADTVHPQHLNEKACLAYLTAELAVVGIKPNLGAMVPLLLPTYAGKPLPSPELQTVDSDGEATLQTWQVYAYPLPRPCKEMTFWVDSTQSRVNDPGHLFFCGCLSRRRAHDF